MNGKELGSMPLSGERNTHVSYDSGAHWIKLGGITLRQHFAGLAMQGLIGSPSAYATGSDAEIAYISRESVCLADALLAELAKDQP